MQEKCCPILERFYNSTNFKFSSLISSEIDIFLLLYCVINFIQRLEQTMRAFHDQTVV